MSRSYPIAPQVPDIIINAVHMTAIAWGLTVFTLYRAAYAPAS
jgi:hypothetical protein